jgi:DNA polymerase I-like protein with 3'-5' exonuclease and polymerase domains
VYADPDEVYKLTNYLMQGSGADLAKMAAIEMENHGLADLIVVSVHDEYCFSLPKDEGPGLAEDLRAIMAGLGDSLAVKLPVDVDGPGRSWGALYEEKP